METKQKILLKSDRPCSDCKKEIAIYCVDCLERTENEYRTDIENLEKEKEDLESELETIKEELDEAKSKIEEIEHILK